jgi:hypothetical protein
VASPEHCEPVPGITGDCKQTYKIMKPRLKLFIVCLIVGYTGLFTFNLFGQTVRNDRGLKIERGAGNFTVQTQTTKAKAASIAVESIAAKQATTFFSADGNPYLVIVYYSDTKNYEVTGKNEAPVLFVSTQIDDVRRFCKGELMKLL